MIPQVSVIVPCHNQGIFLSECLQSVLEQTFKGWECIIVDDGSADNTRNVSLDFCKKDKRFRYFFQPNAGVSAARNKGINNSSGSIILPLDGDDKIGPGYLAEGSRILNERPGVKIVYCNAVFFGDVNRKWDLPAFSIPAMLKDNIIFCSAMYRREDFNKTAGYNTRMVYCFEDWDFWLSLLETGGEVFRLDSLNFYYRIRKNSRNALQDTEKKEEMIRLLYLNHKHLFDKFNIDPLLAFRERVKAETSSIPQNILARYWRAAKKRWSGFFKVLK